MEVNENSNTNKTNIDVKLIEPKYSNINETNPNNSNEEPEKEVFKV